MKHPEWAAAIQRESVQYPWLVSQFPEKEREKAAENDAMVAFDPLRKGRTTIECWTRPELAGMTAAEMRDAFGEEMVELASEGGGRVQGGVRTEITELGQQEAVSFEVVALPGESSSVNQPVKYWSFATADVNQGYWIEVKGIEQELTQDTDLIRAILDTFSMIKHGEE